MADPRFYDNRGPFTLAEICAKTAGIAPQGASMDVEIFDLASLDGAGPMHLSFFAGGRKALESFHRSAAGFCFVPAKEKKLVPPSGMTLLACATVNHAFAIAARLFYPEASLSIWQQDKPVDPRARLGKDVVLGPNVVIGPGAEIGDGAKIGAGSVIAPGVTIGRDCEIGSNVSISHAYIGDRVMILPGAQIGQPGFGFASSQNGHAKVPQLGRVIIQDNVSVGSCTCIDRGAWDDTVIGENTKIDNLVQIAHNVRLGRNCLLAAHTGISGSCTVGDGVAFGGQAGISDHVNIGDGAKVGADAGVMKDIPAGEMWAGTPARPIRRFLREAALIAKLAKAGERD